ncbi:MAG: hypothetical protein HQM14_11390 [SAR324 cluster bacterium]|nr:hypothetical protein [SAR324 cluster bacterium]
MNSVFSTKHFRLNLLIPVVGMLMVLLPLCVWYSNDLPNDSYQHFQTSVDVWQALDWKSWIVDTWNKPFPSLLYGISGQWGISSARFVSVLLTMVTGLLTYWLADFLMQSNLRKHPWTFVGFFFCQLAVLPQSFLTMTELPAAFLLILGLCFYYAKRHFLAYVTLGFLPMARLEISLTLAWVFIIFSLESLEEGRWSHDTWLHVIWCNGWGGLPFLVWWGTGFHYTEKWSWPLESAYSPYLRPFNFFDILQVNALTALPGVLSSVALFLFFLGLWQLPAVVPACFSLRKRSVCLLLYGMLFIHGVFLSSFVVYPKGSRFGDLGIGAINSRNFNVISPLLAIFIFAGAVSLINIVQKKKSIRKLVYLLALTEVILVAFFLLQQQLGTSLVKGWIKFGIHNGLLFVFCIWVLWHVSQGKIGRTAKATRLLMHKLDLSSIAGIVIISFVCSVPLFWHPLRFYDQNFLAQKDLCGWLTEYSGKRPVPLEVIQDTNSRLVSFCQLSSVNASWQWAHFFVTVIAAAPPGSLVILETDENFHPRSRYPAELLEMLQDSSHFELIKKSRIIPVKPWEHWFNKISARNIPARWVVYQKLPRPLTGLVNGGLISERIIGVSFLSWSIKRVKKYQFPNSLLIT